MRALSLLLLSVRWRECLIVSGLTALPDFLEVRMSLLWNGHTPHLPLLRRWQNNSCLVSPFLVPIFSSLLYSKTFPSYTHHSVAPWIAMYATFSIWGRYSIFAGCLGTSAKAICKSISLKRKAYIAIPGACMMTALWLYLSSTLLYRLIHHVTWWKDIFSMQISVAPCGVAKARGLAWVESSFARKEYSTQHPWLHHVTTFQALKNIPSSVNNGHKGKKHKRSMHYEQEKTH